MSRRLFVGNLSYQTRNFELKEYFQRYGRVVDVVVMESVVGRSKGFGYVEFETVECANRALGDANRSTFMGRHIRVDLATERREKEGRRDGERPRSRSRSRESRRSELLDERKPERGGRFGFYSSNGISSRYDDFDDCNFEPLDRDRNRRNEVEKESVDGRMREQLSYQNRERDGERFEEKSHGRDSYGKSEKRGDTHYNMFEGVKYERADERLREYRDFPRDDIKNGCERYDRREYSDMTKMGLSKK
ncbi:FUS-interacting serine-arginine-rich protein, putative [Entamoeba invadens IP1]|uniref:FUS-interacting serine-arginine-rich protein, putative n=1 Tax=Entamoeba invadens IP1 TaxID=370355 RepID=A0A0A1TVA5_ENTIV|nr:FUS-interacting serine-arginine-rich protein, putative [Entamoeba invadens IP1]ELP84294.1 FUS-interacting serine-arginine-rich protein, putative [Entamoeba invadens IP1]|eukprot:XP_004183640.1 FUS-interacting serine-arginine-rich protein, putative [Entamoeba invadens IP1]